MSTKANRDPICDNCRCVGYRNDNHGEVHRYCGLSHNWIPDNEMFPTFTNHAYTKKGGKA